MPIYPAACSGARRLQQSDRPRTDPYDDDPPDGYGCDDWDYAGPESTATTSSVGGQAAPLAGYGVVADVALPGGTSRFDYQSLDPLGHRLLIAHLGASEVLVFDTVRQQITHVIPDIAGVHGVLLVPQRGRIYAAATDKNQVAVIDDQSYAVVATVPTGRYPDGLAYDQDDGKVFVSDEAGGGETVVDVTGNRRLTDIVLGGDVGNTQYNGAAHRVYVAVGARNQLAAIDPATDRVTGWTDLPSCQHAHGLLLDPSSPVAYVACDGNATLLSVDLRAGRVRATQSVGDGPDVLALDPALGRLYVAAESGVVSVFHVEGAQLQKVTEGRVAPSAHTVAVDPATHRIYLPLENVAGKPVLRIMAPEQTPQAPSAGRS